MRTWGDIDNRLALQTTNPILTNTCHWLIKMLERLKIVLNNSNLIIYWAINKVFDGCIKIFSMYISAAPLLRLHCSLECE